MEPLKAGNVCTEDRRPEKATEGLVKECVWGVVIWCELSSGTQSPEVILKN